jgi:hypothetical protein
MELTINELDDLYGTNSNNDTWHLPETEGTNERTFSAQQYNPDDLLPPAYMRQARQPQPQPQLQPQPLKREPLNYDDILLKLNVQIVNGVMRYVDPRKGFTFENAAKTNAPIQVKPQVSASAQPLTPEQHKECRIKQEMDRRRLIQVKSTKMLIPNNNASISRPAAKAPLAKEPSANAPSVKCPVINGTGMFKMKMGR